MAVRLAPWFGEDCTEREPRSETTLASYTTGASEFKWTETRQEFEMYLQVLRRQSCQQAKDLTVSIEGACRRVLVVARLNRDLVATEGTSWLADLDKVLDKTRLTTIG